MMYISGDEYNTCVSCGANLDFDEVCDCSECTSFRENEQKSRLDAGGERKC